MAKQPKCYVHLGRFGDLMILLPGWKREFDKTGIKPVVMVAEEFASIFDGASYVQPWVERLQFCAEARKAKAMAEAQFEQVIFPRWWDIGQPPIGGSDKLQAKVVFQGQEFSLAAEDWVSHQISQWRVAGFDESGLREWPLVFDRRDLRRESDLAKSVFKTNKPKLLLNLRGLSSPFAAVPEILNPLDGLRSRFEFVDLSSVRAERIYDLLGLIDRAAAMITVDTSTLHLAAASKTPYVAIVVDGARGSVPKGNCALAVRYADAPKLAGQIFAATANVLQSVPVVIEENPVEKPKTKSCWMMPKAPSIAIAYLYPCDARETFVPFAKRWAESYRKFAPTIAHDVIVSMSNGSPDANDFAVFDGIPAKFNVGYNGGGWDIGNFQHVSRVFNHDLVVFMNSRAFFWKDGWLERFVEARERFGPDGLYGVMASFEHCPIPGTFTSPNPHIRTSCFVTNPKILRQYPHLIDSREQSFKFESGEWNISDWYAKQGLPVKLVTADGFYDRHEWRKPPNIFRRGDQSNCLISDRHTLLYAEASKSEKRGLSASADAGNPVIPVRNFVRPKTITVVAATSINARGHAKAIDRTAAAIPHPCERLLISSDAAPGFTGKHVPLPEPWAKNGKWTLDDMCDFLLSGIFKYIETDFALIVHDDGYALNPSKWTNDFLSYDYIGSPWPRHFRWTTPQHRVGNGGFSLRSKRWLERAASLPKIPCGTSEDVYCGVTNVDHFIKAGLRIAPLVVAMKWGMEHPIEEFPRWKLSDSLGFHGLTTVAPDRKNLRLS